MAHRKLCCVCHVPGTTLASPPVIAAQSQDSAGSAAVKLLLRPQVEEACPHDPRSNAEATWEMFAIKMTAVTQGHRQAAMPGHTERVLDTREDGVSRWSCHSARRPCPSLSTASHGKRPHQ